MRYNAKELRYEQVEIFGKKALFSDVRIERDSVPKGLLLYEVRHDDGAGHLVEIARGILVNFYGTLLVEGGLPEADKNGRVLVEDEDWQCIGERTCTLEEYFLQGKSKKIEQYVPLVRLSMIREREVPYAWEVFNKPEKVAEFAKGILHGADREYLLVLSIDSKCRPVAVEIVSIGTVNATLAEPREAFKHAILTGATGIILVHNHVSGDCMPSGEDTALTGRLAKAGRLLGIPVEDHVIIGERFFSFRNDSEVLED